MRLSTRHLLSLALSGFFALAPAQPVFNVPLVKGLTADGSASDWGDQGFRVEAMSIIKGSAAEPSDFDPRFRLAWNDEGLWLLATIKDDIAVEQSDSTRLYLADCIEIFVAEKKGSPNFYQTIVSSGADTAFGRLRQAWFDHRARSRQMPALASRGASATQPGGYTVEMVLPWPNLGIQKPAIGDERAFQLYVGDRDGGENRTAVFYPGVDNWRDPTHMHRIRLSKGASAPVHAAAVARYEAMDSVVVDVTADQTLKGARVVVTSRTKAMGSAPLRLQQGRLMSRLAFPFPPHGTNYGGLTVALGDAPIAVLQLDDADRIRGRAIADLRVAADRFTFDGDAAPVFDFNKPELARRLLGPYSVKTVLYNSAFRPVAAPKTPGRYGAVIDFVTQRGDTLRRFATACRAAGTLDWRVPLVKSLKVELGDSLRIAPAAQSRHAEEMAQYARDALSARMLEDQNGARLLCGLYEDAGADPVHAYNDVLAVDRQWWVTLKRRLNGTDKRFPQTFTAPREIGQTGAPALRNGTAAEAGMDSSAVKDIDAVLTKWAQESREPFAVSLARRGVVFHEKAYGQTDKGPMTLGTKCWMASITKLMSASLMMMLVDQGLVRLDDTVGAFLPQFAGVKVAKPLTIRHLYTHTAGLWDHWGEDLTELENIVAEYYPYLEVGKRHDYTGLGNALGSRILETVTGEALPQFFRAHLLKPLGCDSTDVRGSYGDAYSISRDMAKLGQMLLNKGAYGRWRFFGPETFATMLPRPIGNLVEPPVDLTWGIGTVIMEDKGLSPNAFGHGAASSAILIVDPDKELVISMTRNNGGEKYDEYRAEFVKAVVGHLGK